MSPSQDEIHESQRAARQELAAAGVTLPARSAYRPRPLNTLLASAQRVTSRTLQRGWGKSKAWQDDAWDVFDLVGEHRFLAVTLAGRMSQAKIFVGTMPKDDTEDPVPVEDPAITSILDSIGSSAAARAQMIARLGVNLFVAGDGWLVGIPRHLVPPNLLVGTLSEPVVDPSLIPLPGPDATIDITTLDWRMLSISEVATLGTGQVMLRLGETNEDTLMVNPDDLILIRVWRPHPRLWWEADSPTRSSLPILRELIGLTMRSSAEIDSRLAGAGLLVVPQSAQRALQIAAGIEDDLDNGAAGDQFTEALMEAMLKPISDRSSASAIVPLVVTVPDEACQLFNFIDFAKPLDQYASERLDKAIRRLALGLDAPPELLLGTGGMNHWGAWLVLEDVVTTHLEPPLALICDALTSQYLWPVLAEQGMSIEQAKQYVIWYDVSDLVVRPTRAADAQAMHTAGVITDAALREANGFDDSDAPESEQTEAALPPEVVIALSMAREHPALMALPGLPQLAAQIKAVLAGQIPAIIDPEKVREIAAENIGQGTPAPPGGNGGVVGGPAPKARVASPVPVGGPKASGPTPLPSAVAAGATSIGEWWRNVFGPCPSCDCAVTAGGKNSGRHPCGSGKHPNQHGCAGVHTDAHLPPGIDSSMSIAAHIGPDGKLTPERQALHDQIVQGTLEGVVPSPTGKPTFYFMGGGPASGKSVLLGAGIGIPTGSEAVQINADDVKGLLPEYVAGVAAKDAGASVHVHEESSMIAKKIQAQAIAQGLDIVLDGTGDHSAAKMGGKVNTAKAAGYRTVGAYVTVPTDVAVQRATKRGNRTGRVVPEATIRDTHASVSRVLPELAPTFDEISLYDNTVSPVQVMSGKAGVITIHDQSKWDDFVAKGAEGAVAAGPSK